MSATAPEGADYRIHLYNSNRQIEAQNSETGDSEVTFDLTGYEPGSYLLILSKNGNYEAVYPVVIRGYDVSVDAPSSAAPDSDVTVSVTAEKTETVEDPSAVRVVLATDDESVEATATKQSSGEYQATVSLDAFQTGDVRVYAVVQGSDDAFRDDRKELLGISDPSTLTISEDAGQSTTEQTTSSTVTETTTATTVTSTPGSTTATTTTTSVTSTTESTTTPDPATSTTTNSSVITPEQSTTTTTNTTTTMPGQGVPGFGVAGGLLAVVGLLLIALRR